MAPLSVQLLGRDPVAADALRSVPVGVDDGAVAMVGEGSLDQATGADVGRRLAAGDVVIVLAQHPSAAAFYPVPVTLLPVAGQPLLRLTIDHGVLPSLMAGEGELEAGSAVAGAGPGRFPDRPVAGSTSGTVVGSHQVGRGRLVFCQFELCARATHGDRVGQAVLADLVRWASVPRPTLAIDESRHPDGRRVARYARTWTVAR